MAENTRTCPHCQASVRADLRFCPECGQELRPAAARQARRPHAGISQKQIALLLAGGLALICISCAALIIAIRIFAPALFTPAEEIASDRTPVALAATLSTATLTPATIPSPGGETPSPAATALPTGTTGPTSAPASTPERTEAQVVHVVDGDTIDVQIDGQTYPLRYIGIDAPEVPGTGQPGEWLGPEASLANERLVGAQTVYLEVDVSETDPYGRLLRYVFLPDGALVNAELVRLGYARAHAYPPDLKYQELLEQMEQEARAAGRGLWGSTPTPVSPTAATSTTTASATAAAATSTPTLTATPAPTEAPTGAPTSLPAARIVIVDVVNSGTSEYVEIANEGDAEQDMSLWSVRGSSGSQRYVFPGGYILGPGARVRLHSGDGGIDAPPGDIYWTTEEVWDNEGETVYLADVQGRQVHEYSY